MRSGGIRFAFIDSWIQGSARGSGTAVGIDGLQRGLASLGHTVTRLGPEGDRRSSLRRVWFNVQLPDKLHAADYDLVVGFDIDGFAYSASRKRRRPFVASIKGVLAEESRQERGRPKLLLKALSALEGYNAGHADLVVTTSEYCGRAVEHHYGVPADRIAIVPEGVDLSRWPDARRPTGGDGKTILCVARQYRRKRVEDLLHAMAEVRRRVPGARAVVVGDGPEHARLRRLVDSLGLAGAVELTGEVPADDDVVALYRRADVFCLPSVQEGFGIVFLEAMAAGLPIVSTTAAAIPEVVADQGAGLLVPPGDVAALAAALVRLLREPALRAQMSAYGRETVRQYDWPEVAGVFVEQVAPLL